MKVECSQSDLLNQHSKDILQIKSAIGVNGEAIPKKDCVIERLERIEQNQHSAVAVASAMKELPDRVMKWLKVIALIVSMVGGGGLTAYFTGFGRPAQEMSKQQQTQQKELGMLLAELMRELGVTNVIVK